MRRLLDRPLLTLTFALALAGAALSPRRAEAQRSVRWDHAACSAAMTDSDPKCTPILAATAAPGDEVELTITGTCEKDFSYKVVEIGRTQAGGETPPPPACADTVVIKHRHDDRFAGFVVHLRKKEGSKAERGEARITVSVETIKWRTTFAAGFALSGLVDPALALRDVAAPAPPAGTQYVIVDNESDRDRAGRAVVSFIHLHRGRFFKDWIRPALSFGLGLEEGRTSDYYPGLSFLMGDQGALTVGAVLGQVRWLPRGRQVGDTVSDANTLATLGSRRESKLFIAFSYNFLGGKEADFKKPFDVAGKDDGEKAQEDTPQAPPTTPSKVPLSFASLDTTESTITIVFKGAKGEEVTWSAFDEDAPSTVYGQLKGDAKVSDDGTAKATLQLPRADRPAKLMISVTYRTGGGKVEHRIETKR